MSDSITPEELEQIKKDIAAAKGNLVGKELQDEIAKAKEEARRETEERLKREQELKELQESKAKAEEALKKQQEEANTRLEALQTKVDELSGSKNIASGDNPFKENAQGKFDVNKLTDQEIEEIEENSLREFLGADYDRIITQYR